MTSSGAFRAARDLLLTHRTDRVLLMLGNVAPLWEVILAAMKLGAVVIPASTLLAPADLTDRISRGAVRHVVTEAAQLAKFADVPGDWTRIVVDGPAVPDWQSCTDAFGGPADVHLNLSSPGWAKHAWSNLFAPWNAPATILVLNQARFSAAGLLQALGDCWEEDFTWS
jgi:acetyl-CoA synthetase